MLRGILALFFRSLRSDSRSVSVQASWLLLLLVIYGAMVFSQMQARFFETTGLLFFRTVIYIDAVFITLLGIGYFSTAISEEREEDTLGLMTMAGISPLGILLGKSTTRLFQVLILLAVQYPFTLLAITLGGLMPDQIFSSYAALAAYAILLANAGLLCSVLCRRNRDASALTILAIFSYSITPPFAHEGYRFFLTGDGSRNPRWSFFKPILEPLLHYLSQVNVFGELTWVTETGYQFTWTPQLVSNAVGGFALFLLSWWLFQFVPHDVATESTTRVMAPKGAVFAGSTPGRAWQHSLIWKDFHFITGGWLGLLIRMGLYVGMYWLTFAAMYPWHHAPKDRLINWRDVTEGYQFFVVPFFVLDCALCLSRMFHEEIRHQTLTSLLMLPRSMVDVVYQKLAGCALGLIPGLIALVAAFFMFFGATRTTSQLVEQPGAWLMAANLLLLLHMSTMLSTYLRQGAFILSLIFFGCSLFLFEVTINTFRFNFGISDTDMLMMMKLLIVPTLLACGCCHLVILLRLPALGGK